MGLFAAFCVSASFVLIFVPASPFYIVDSQLAIETSGHAAFKENFFLDDGAYLAAKVVIKERVPGRLVVKADFAADSRRRAAFFGYLIRHRECGNPARLGAAYHARLPAPGIQTHPGELGGFAGAGVADQHKTSIAGNRRHNLVMMGHYGELRGKGGQSCLHCRWKGTKLIYNAIPLDRKSVV